MHLKLRLKRRQRHHRGAVEALPSRCNLLIYKQLTLNDTRARRMQKLAADVHLYSVDKYGESTAVHKKVLIVDDSPAEVKLMQGLLEKEGYWPIGLNDPKRVEETIANERPSVILLDVVMPDRNGFQICRDLKGNAEFSMIPVIMVTSKDSASDKFWGEQQGADGYVTKPFTREDLLRAVRRFA
jgi:twitching motility two-component system response regulator PilH